MIEVKRITFFVLYKKATCRRKLKTITHIFYRFLYSFIVITLHFFAASQKFQTVAKHMGEEKLKQISGSLLTDSYKYLFSFSSNNFLLILKWRFFILKNSVFLKKNLRKIRKISISFVREFFSPLLLLSKCVEWSRLLCICV